jgi:hypothetical protein
LDQNANDVERKPAAGDDLPLKTLRPNAISASSMMEASMRAVFMAVAFIALAAPAVGQSRLPRVGPAEQEVRGINRSIQREQRDLGAQQQNQFNNNQLRQDLNRQRSFSNPVVPGRRGSCPAGSIGC